jgi:hypothetical protein
VRENEDRLAQLHREAAGFRAQLRSHLESQLAMLAEGVQGPGGVRRAEQAAGGPATASAGGPGFAAGAKPGDTQVVAAQRSAAP